MGLSDFLEDAAKQAGTAAQSMAAGDAAAAGTEASAVSSLLGKGGAQLPGLLEKLNVGGLGDVVNSWVGTGENGAVTAAQIKAALSSEQVAGIAAKLGISPDQAADKIAQILPGIIDKLTPDGLVPDPDSVADKLTGLLK